VHKEALLAHLAKRLTPAEIKFYNSTKDLKELSLISAKILSDEGRYVKTEIGVLRVNPSFFEPARYLATRKILKKFLRIESHHHDNGNVSNRTSMDTGLFNTNL
jgi:hypothetical protein